MTVLRQLDHEHMPPPRRGRRPLRILGVIAAVFVLVLALAGLWLERQIQGHPNGPTVHVTIPPGSSASSIGRLLNRKGVVGNPTVFRLYALVTRPGPLHSADYDLRHHESMGHVFSALQGSVQAAVHKVTIPEGSSLHQVAAIVGRVPGLSADRFLALAQSGTVRSRFEPPGSTSLEGLLFPDTYFVKRGDDESTLLTHMVAAFDDQATQAGVPDAGARAGVSPYDAIVVASLVEKEAKVDDDRPKIARVIYNRITKNMKLGVDATVDYALGVHKPQLTTADLNIDSPYNTRRYPGLPPTPIAAPGRKSLDAALTAAPGPWLYYVLADATGRHAFATTDAEFEQLRRQAQQKGLL